MSIKCCFYRVGILNLWLIVYSIVTHSMHICSSIYGGWLMVKSKFDLKNEFLAINLIFKIKPRIWSFLKPRIWLTLYHTTRIIICAGNQASINRAVNHAVNYWNATINHAFIRAVNYINTVINHTVNHVVNYVTIYFYFYFIFIFYFLFLFLFFCNMKTTSKWLD